MYQFQPDLVKYFHELIFLAKYFKNQAKILLKPSVLFTFV